MEYSVPRIDIFALAKSVARFKLTNMSAGMCKILVSASENNRGDMTVANSGMQTRGICAAIGILEMMISCEYRFLAHLMQVGVHEL